MVETSLATYPGTFFTRPSGGAQEVARYWPTVVDAAVPPVVNLDGAPGRGRAPAPGAPPLPPRPTVAPATTAGGGAPGEVVEVPLGVLVGGRSGDKGGDANIGLWADTDEVAEWLLGTLRREALPLLPEAAGLESTATRWPTCGPSTSSCTASWGGAWRRTCGSTPRPRGWPNWCAPAP